MQRRSTFPEDAAKAFLARLAASVFGAMDACILALVIDAPFWAVFAVFLIASDIAYWGLKN